jgi:hypothetical protein
VVAIRVILPPEIAARHRNAALKYFEKTERLGAADWALILETFDALSRAVVTIGRKRWTFRQVYDRYVDLRYSDDFISRLLARDDPEAQAPLLQRETASAMLGMLEEEGLYREDVPGSEYLAAYCLYWWTAFARGYAFEATVFRDLRDSGIAFVAHDLRKRRERLSPYDLTVLRQLGDVKNTTYFLHAARTASLTCDFYITRLYDARRRRYVRVVVLTEMAWQVLDGEITVATLETAADRFPHPVGLVFNEQRFVLVTYDLWKEKVKQRLPEEA